MIDFKGVFPIVPTPLTPSESLDEPALRRVLRYVIEGGVNGLWMLGSGGEQPILKPEDARRALEISLEEANGKLPVVAGIGACSVWQAVDNLRMAEEVGVDAVQSVEPYYFSHRAAEIVDYFLTLADTAKIPLIIYHHPHRWPSGSMAWDALPNNHGRLAKHPNIIGMKDVTMNFRDIQRIVFNLASDDFTVMTAAGRLLYATLAIGGHGGAIPESVLAPKLYVDLYNAFTEGDFLKARNLQSKLAPLGDAINCPAYAGAKMGLHLLGLSDTTLISPLQGVADKDRDYLATIMKNLGLI